MSWGVSAPTRPTCSRSFLPPSGTPGIETPCSKQEILLRAHDCFTNSLFLVCVSLRLLVLREPIFYRGESVVHVRCIGLLRLNILKAVIPVPTMDGICSPGGEALRSHQVPGRNHNCHRSQHCRAWSFRPPECLAGRNLQYDQ